MAVGLAENQALLQKSSLPEGHSAGFIAGYLESPPAVRGGTRNGSSSPSVTGVAANSSGQAVKRPREPPCSKDFPLGVKAACSRMDRDTYNMNPPLTRFHFVTSNMTGSASPTISGRSPDADGYWIACGAMCSRAENVGTRSLSVQESRSGDQRGNAKARMTSDTIQEGDCGRGFSRLVEIFPSRNALVRAFSSVRRPNLWNPTTDRSAPMNSVAGGNAPSPNTFSSR